MSKKATQTIADLIEVPPIRTVIQLVDTESADLRRELLDSFVFTEEIRQLFDRLLHALARPCGLGAFIKGHYGSGKSHCLTYLQMLLQGEPEARRRLPLAGERSWLVVSLPLLAFSAQSSLEQVVMTGIEEALWKETGQRPLLADRSRLLENFRKFIVPAYAAELAGWGELADEQAATAALEFLRGLPQNPLQLSYDRREVMQHLQSALQGRGLVLLMDELSEYLRSRQAGFAEDIRYLQFLGEWAEKMPLWIVATLQQDLEELGYGQEPAYLRIKERYPLRFSLSSRHVADLIEGRLIRRKPDSLPVLEQLWQQLDRVFPGMIERKDFLRIYPVHPATLELLEHLMSLFSRHRGVVDFVHTRLAGDRLKGAEGILHEPPDRLLTPDTIFDHFRERFSELAQLAPYEQTVFAHLQAEIPQLYANDRDRQVALQCLKLLILIEVCPVPIEATAERLSQMLARRISKVDPAVNVAYLREQILDVLVDKGAFVVRKGNRYALDLAANVNQVLGQKVRAQRQKLKADWLPLLERVNRSNLPLVEMVGRALQPNKIRWRNSDRVILWGLTRLGHADLKLVQAQLEHQDADAALLLLRPDDDAAAPGKLLAGLQTESAIAFWVPAPAPADLQELLLDWLAHQAVYEQTQQQRDLRAHLAKLVEDQLARLERAVFDLYARGAIVTASGQASVPTHETSRDRFLAAALGASLDRRFPSFASIAPSLDGLHNANLGRLWENLLVPGSAPRGAMDTLIEGLLTPLQMVEKEDQTWRLRAHPLGVVAQVLDLIPAKQRMPLSELERILKKGPWGLARAQFHLILASLVQQGRIQLFAHGRAFPLQHINALIQHKADEVALDHHLGPEQVEELGRLSWMTGVALQPARPKEFWTACQERLGQLEELAGDVGASLARCGHLGHLPLQEVAQAVEQVQKVVAAVGHPASSTSGLARLVEHKAGELQAREELLLRWQEFLKTGARDFEATRRRLQALGDEALLAEMDRLPQAVDLAEAWRDLRDRIAEWEAGYRERYLVAHEGYYQAECFGLRKTLLLSPEWKAVEKLAGVLGLEVNPTPLRVRLDALPQACRKRVEEQLLTSPRCACGFTPGQAEPPVEDLLTEIREILKQSCARLVQQEQRLEQYLRSLHQLGQEQRAARVDAVLTLAASLAQPSPLPNFWPRAAGQLAELLDAPCQQQLSQALTGHTLLVVRRLEDLLNVLCDQRLPAERVRKLFEAWLQGDGLRSDCWLHLVHGQELEGASQAGAWLGAWLQQHGLEATAAMRRRYQIGGEPEGEPPEGELWELLQPCLTHLDAGREKLFPRVSAELCRRALEAEQPGLAATLPDLPWEHLEVARAASLAIDSRGDFCSLARGWREWSRARHLDLSAGLLRPEWEESMTGRLAGALAQSRCETVPLADAPRLLAGEWLAGRRLIVFLVDGLRWDLWDLLKPTVEAEIGPALEEILALSPLPSLTSQARLALLGGSDEIPGGADGLLLDRPLTYLKAADEKRHRPRAEELLRGREPAVMLHLGFIDKRRHDSHEELWPLYQALLGEAQLRLMPLLKKVPPGCVFLLLSDHGFTDPIHKRAHGGATKEERVIPAAVWLR